MRIQQLGEWLVELIFGSRYLIQTHKMPVVLTGGIMDYIDA